MSYAEAHLKEVYKRRAELECFAYGPDYDPDLKHTESTWKVPFVHKGKEYQLEVYSKHGKFGLNWWKCNKVAQKILNVDITDASGKYKWRKERSEALFARHPHIPMDDWQRTKRVHMSEEWLDFWKIHQEHMCEGQDVKDNEPKYLNFWHRALEGPFDERTFTIDDFNDFSWEFYDDNHANWKEQDCYKVILNLHKSMVTTASALFPEIKMRSGGNLRAVRYWVFR